MPTINSNPQVSFDKELNKANTAAPKQAADSAQKNEKAGEAKQAEKAASLSPQEKVALGAAGAAAGAAACLVCIVDDDMLEKAKNLGKKAGEAVKEHYKHPPEEKMLDSLKKGLSKAGDSIEEFADDLKDGRVARDVSKSVKRFARDHFSEQSPLDKAKNAIKDTAEDAVDAAADAIDDIKDGRAGKKIAKAIEDLKH